MTGWMLEFTAQIIPSQRPGWVQIYLRTTPVFKGPFYVKKADYECAINMTDSLYRMP